MKKPFKIVMIDEFGKTMGKIKDPDPIRLKKKTMSMFDKLV